MASHSNGTTKPSKHRDFPLTPHPSGRWCKKVRGKLHYFGPWGNPQAALEKWLEQKDDLLAGRKPRVAGGVEVRDICNGFLAAKQRKLDAGELKRCTWKEYFDTCSDLAKVLGANHPVADLRSEDFGKLRSYFSKDCGPVSLGNQIRKTRVIFKYAYDADIIDRPIKFGPEFREPDKASKRKARQAKHAKLFGSEEIHKLLQAASVQMRAMILLGINCGLGNTDCSDLAKSALDLERGILFYPRPKTAIERRAPLWPETVAAIRAAIAERPDAKDAADADCLFITRYGHRWVRFRDTGPVNSISLEFSKLMVELGLDKIGGKDRDGVSFYALRHTLETIGGETGDQSAVDRIMGHSRPDMATHYREWCCDEREDARLRKVTDHVHGWLYSAK